MKKVILLLLFPLIFAALLLTGCKKDNDSDSNPDNQNAEPYPFKTIIIPEVMAQSANPGALMAVEYISSYNDMAAYSSMLKPPGKSVRIFYKDDGEEIYNWETDNDSGKYTSTLKIWKSDYKTTWELFVTGNLDGHELTNFKYLSAIHLNDGTGDSFVVYNPATGLWHKDINWYGDGNGNDDLAFTVFEETKLHVALNSDGSGSLEYSLWVGDANMEVFKAQWNTNGHGIWWQYDDGMETGNGSW